MWRLGGLIWKVPCGGDVSGGPVGLSAARGSRGRGSLGPGSGCWGGGGGVPLCAALMGPRPRPACLRPARWLPLRTTCWPPPHQPILEGESQRDCLDFQFPFRITFTFVPSLQGLIIELIFYRFLSRGNMFYLVSFPLFLPSFHPFLHPSLH